MFTVLTHKGNEDQNYTKIRSHSCQIGNHQENKQQQMHKNAWKQRTFIHCWWECENITTTVEVNMEVCQTTYDPTIPFLGTYPKGYKS
jgi:hypothetical protein